MKYYFIFNAISYHKIYLFISFYYSSITIYLSLNSFEISLEISREGFDTLTNVTTKHTWVDKIIPFQLHFRILDFLDSWSTFLIVLRKINEASCLFRILIEAASLSWTGSHISVLICFLVFRIICYWNAFKDKIILITSNNILTTLWTTHVFLERTSNFEQAKQAWILSQKMFLNCSQLEWIRTERCSKHEL